ncbi:ABC transporter permease [Leucobacter luti]|uniref:Peptide/nickel transport system permease protein n=1 Tax=Leucobacter luti TaxID=340320 RepID=A0A4R6S6J4_9MICO|nr:ABC transporter permease [Leucobacter luti]MCW2288939.1 peptide/nickel transport system permease protein [Leucobacter luti]QYM75175.1 ABC transporter permease [Leucobacter luti]TCK44911.1 peptide/nickel transport system permease protein [Leucobacter luti]TDP95432.1 peptide/nickel transport system permease protein [Leucobacter luti]
MSRTDVISMIAAPQARDPRRRIPKWLRTPTMVASGVVLLGWLVMILIPALTPYDPLATVGPALTAPDGNFLLGTDALGRDNLSRTLAAARTSVPNGLMIVAAAALIGTTIGLIAGFFGGWIDEVLMRIADLVFAFPGIILAMAIAAALGPSIQNAVIAAAVSWWPAYARAVRSIVLALRESEFVLSNRLSGVGPFRSIFVDLLPAVSGSVLVLAMLDIGSAILFLAGLSFLGLGAVPPAPEWGSMISGAVQYFDQWWLAIAPGIAIVTVVLAFNIIGDAIRDNLEPRLTESGGAA